MAKTLQPADWVRPRGFSNALSIAEPGRWILVAGQIGSDAQGNVVSDDMGAQTAQAFRNIVRLLAEDGASAAHLVSLTWYVTSRGEYQAAGAAIGAAYKEVIGKHFPTITLVVVAGLLSERAKVEIQATAFVPD
jgi:enamine deaminase RidA (YjgF/YER057c/UK114 family)